MDVHYFSQDFLTGLATSQNIICRTMFSELYWKVILPLFIMQSIFFKDVTNVRIVIHGNGAFSHALYDLLKEDPAFHNIVLDDSEEIPIAAQGAFHLAMKDLQTH